jgi:hypothetical protein
MKREKEKRLKKIAGASLPTLGSRLFLLLKTIDKSVNTKATQESMATMVDNLIMAFLLIINLNNALKIINYAFRPCWI